MVEYLKVALVADIPAGTGKAVEAKGKRIALFNVAGSFHAIDGTCPHQGGPLGEGFLKGTVVTCPWHFWQYDVVTGKANDFPDTALEVFEVRVEGDDVLIGV